MKSSATPEPKARAAADAEDFVVQTEREPDPASVPASALPTAPSGPELASESGEASSKPKRKSKASLAGSEPNNVRKLRQEAMMSKAELARRAGVSPLTIDRVEAGSPCRMDTKRKILEALGLSPSARAEVWPDIDDQG
jgi:DNA-binding XRE family transcriptional regulator